MNKCEWKDGVYKPCEKMAKQIIDDVTEKGSFILSDYTECGCGGNLKPEEKPLIVKSGETWAAHCKGIDYLCMVPEEYMQTNMIHIIGLGDEDWKPFSEIELTDTIAKFRPMVIIHSGIVQLYGVMDWPMNQYLSIVKGGESIFTDTVRLATPHELQEAE